MEKESIQCVCVMYALYSQFIHRTDRSLIVHEVLYCSFVAKRQFVAIAAFNFLET